MPQPASDRVQQLRAAIANELALAKVYAQQGHTKRVEFHRAQAREYERELQRLLGRRPEPPGVTPPHLRPGVRPWMADKVPPPARPYQPPGKRPWKGRPPRDGEDLKRWLATHRRDRPHYHKAPAGPPPAVPFPGGGGGGFAPLSAAQVKALRASVWPWNSPRYRLRLAWLRQRIRALNRKLARERNPKEREDLQRRRARRRAELRVLLQMAPDHVRGAWRPPRQPPPAVPPPRRPPLPSRRAGPPMGPALPPPTIYPDYGPPVLRTDPNNRFPEHPVPMRPPRPYEVDPGIYEPQDEEGHEPFLTDRDGGDVEEDLDAEAAGDVEAEGEETGLQKAGLSGAVGLGLIGLVLAGMIGTAWYYGKRDKKYRAFTVKQGKGSTPAEKKKKESDPFRSSAYGAPLTNRGARRRWRAA